ncbi:Putative flippase GtrA (transmembrane translocase of bactoprenol-linked glucose) [Pseudorhodobacter antarcticus]|uniref:Putative flippase GtrA (Transmembrane translocase of bactoprenol-linked glucose) n=1 Tax=Pseudorhodobacter antarcticus TaxID=1077947 RepID=A0A1H8N2T7_9RHOB|nr:GtrA family protein [Pseudorhodobacter antarcticus]SEO23882.1 Putative flippase GtrA (transmembrane translocase of bactoprenol-linked glucose) [Pseudorhodobacter antarcticus]
MILGNIRTILFYFGVGGFSAAVYVVLATLLTKAGMTAWIASAICYLLITPFAYLGQHRWTFASKSEHMIAFPRYLALQALGLSLASLLPLLLVDQGIQPTLIFATVAVTVAALNFVLMKIWVFVNSKENQEE